MGREIRRVPAGWEHPRYTAENAVPRYRDGGYTTSKGEYRPLYDDDFRTSLAEWLEGLRKWDAGEMPSYADEYEEYWDYEGGPPRPEYYRPAWSDGEQTHFQMYETVSEGTPLSPPMPSLDALADWLTNNEDFWGHGPRTREQADAFCRSGWAPSFVFSPATGLVPGLESLASTGAT